MLVMYQESLEKSACLLSQICIFERLNFTITQSSARILYIYIYCWHSTFILSMHWFSVYFHQYHPRVLWIHVNRSVSLSFGWSCPLCWMKLLQIRNCTSFIHIQGFFLGKVWKPASKSGPLWYPNLKLWEYWTHLYWSYRLESLMLAGIGILWVADKSGRSTAALEDWEKMCRNLSLCRVSAGHTFTVSMFVNEIKNSWKWMAKPFLVSSNIPRGKYTISLPNKHRLSYLDSVFVIFLIIFWCFRCFKWWETCFPVICGVCWSTCGFYRASNTPCCCVYGPA